MMAMGGATCTDAGPEPVEATREVTAQNAFIARAATWFMWNQGEPLPPAWTQHDWVPTFPPTSVTAPAGYGESYVNPISFGSDPSHKPITVYFRKAFFVASPADVASLRLDVMYDDGFVYYVNGVEGGRAAMPGGTITRTTLSTGHEADNTYLSFDATGVKSALHAGWNTLAVEVHQVAPSSSDLVFDASLVAQVQVPLPVGGIPAQSTWSYWDRGGSLGSTWRTPGFDDTTWASGQGPLGYGESYLNGTIGFGPSSSNKFITTYFRKQFTVVDPSLVFGIEGQVMYDDGVVIYLNGQEITRASMPSGTISATTLATGHEANAQYVNFDWGAFRALLVPGVNTVAVEVHQAAASSSDLVFDLALTLAATQPPPDIARRSLWRYWDLGGNLGTTWRDRGFSDATWNSGGGPLGYGESYLNGTIGFGPSSSNKFITTYFRRPFQVNDPTAVTAITGELMWDDGAVIYLNGHEIGRASMPGGTITATTLSTGHEASNAYTSFDWTAQKVWLVPGVNVIAVEVHQVATSSSDLVFDLALHLDTGPTAIDTDGDRLPDSVETNTGVFVNAGNTGTSPTNRDTDGDGLDDGDEVLGTTGGLNLPAMGVSPTHKNILLEFDWFDDANECGSHSHRPTAALLAELADAFVAAPIHNPDGVDGVSLVFDYGQGGPFTGGNLIADADGVLDGFFDGEYTTYKAANFAANRQGYLHYVMMPHRYGLTNDSSGLAEIIGDDMIVSLQCSTFPDYVRNTIMHELGHNLGLQHGGFGDSTNLKPNYNSVMNYLYQFAGVDTNCTPPGDGYLDFSRHRHIDLDENALREVDGICGAAAGVSWDWNYNGSIDAVPYPLDLNSDVALSVLTDRDDWADIILDFTPSGARGLAIPQVVECDPAP
jgi:hypothetical protein